MPSIIITGSRDFNDLSFLFKIMDDILGKWNKQPTIISSGRPGAETRGEAYAKANGLPLKVFTPDVKTFGYAAITMINQEMAAAATHCVCFYKKEPEVDNLLKACEKIKVKIVPFSLVVDWVDTDKFIYTYDEITG